MKTNKVDVLVIGAGPAGSVAASMINQAGFRVRVVEKTKFPRFVIGESLLPRCMEALEDARLLEAVRQKNFQGKFGAKFLRGEAEFADYIFSDQFSKGWSTTWQVPRADFDTTLAEEIQRQGVSVDFETTVTSIRFDDQERSVTTVQHKDNTTEQIHAAFIVDASGYGKVIPRLFGLEKPATLDPRMALFAHISDRRRDSFDEPGRIIIVVYAPGVWAWVIPFSNGNTSVGFVGSHDFFAPLTGNLTDSFRQLVQGSPYLRKRFGDEAFILAPSKLQSWSSISEKFHGSGFVLTGNVTEFLDPIFSSGVMFATVSGHLAGQLVVKKLKGDPVDFENDYSRILQRGIDTFRSFVKAWYDGTLEKIFFYPNPDRLIKSQITSVLAGYVWDIENPFVRNPDHTLQNLVKRIDARNRFTESQRG